MTIEPTKPATVAKKVKLKFLKPCIRDDMSWLLFKSVSINQGENSLSNLLIRRTRLIEGKASDETLYEFVTKVTGEVEQRKRAAQYNLFINTVGAQSAVDLAKAQIYGTSGNIFAPGSEHLVSKSRADYLLGLKAKRRWIDNSMIKDSKNIELVVSPESPQLRQHQCMVERVA